MSEFWCQVSVKLLFLLETFRSFIFGTLNKYIRTPASLRSSGYEEVQATFLVERLCRERKKCLASPWIFQPLGILATSAVITHHNKRDKPSLLCPDQIPVSWTHEWQVTEVLRHSFGVVFWIAIRKWKRSIKTWILI